MAKKGLSVEIPEELVAALDALAKRTGRNKTLLVKVALSEFLGLVETAQEEIIKRYLKTHEN